MNTINLIGRVSNDLEINQSNGFNTVWISSTKEYKKDSGGQEVDFIPCSVLGNIADWTVINKVDTKILKKQEKVYFIEIK